ncbi:ATP-binding protein [Pontibacter sp. G13]|uniref:ATP-binding protein n=1 Tax=Pontibacter sp. G13 TaxID=3074898 RepID=UPI00288A9793|nr:ATP-binding protein [Pontibacter sp. G13]WNJ20908.1 ATP-binding protein [Pontibacter sp. G13]
MKPSTLPPESMDRNGLIEEIKRLRDMVDPSFPQPARNNFHPFGEILNACPNLITVTDQDCKIIYQNRATGPHLPLVKLGETVCKLVDEPDKQKLLDAFHLVQQNHCTQKIKARRVFPDGSEYWISHQITPLIPKDTIAGYLITSEDITGFSREKDRLIQIHEALAANIPSGYVVMFDHELRYLIADGKGMEPSVRALNPVGKTIYEIFPQEICEQFLEPIYLPTLSGKAISVMQTFQDRHHMVNSHPVRDSSGQIFAGLVITQEVTDLKDAQKKLELANESLEQTVAARTSELEQLNQDLKEMTSILSHDLGGPLRSILSISDLLEFDLQQLSKELTPSLTPGQLATFDQSASSFREHIDLVNRATHQAQRLLEGVIGLAKMGRRELLFEEVDLNQILADIQDALFDQISSSGAEFDLGPLPIIQGDSLSIYQIFQNLVSNALKYRHPDRAPHLSIRAETKENQFSISVQDNGRGISQKDIPQIFQLFQRVGVQNTIGDGMGLTYTQTLVHRHQGKIFCESAIDDGTTFTVHIPKNPQLCD